MNRRGFTAIELVIVLLIVGLLGVIAVKKSGEIRHHVAWKEACIKAGGIPTFPYRSTPLCLRPGNVIAVPEQP